MTTHETTDRPQWLTLRAQLLTKEKNFTRAKDELAAARRALPWVRVEKDYTFESTAGMRSLAQLFGAHSQLIIYHFMFGPDAEAGCKSCSFWADHFGACVPHLAQRDVAFAVVSRAPQAKLQAFKERFGWQFPWYSSGSSDFNYDFDVSFRAEDRVSGLARYNFAPISSGMPSDLPGLSVFCKDAEGRVYHSYSTYGRGIELANATYQLLDLVPKGRDEDAARPMSWLRYKDEYSTHV